MKDNTDELLVVAVKFAGEALALSKIDDNTGEQCVELIETVYHKLKELDSMPKESV